MTWLLVATLCTITAPGQVDCHREAWGPYGLAECIKRARAMDAYLTARDDMLLTVGCVKGRDA